MKIGIGIGLAFKQNGSNAVAPTNTVAPVISGTTTLGSTLSCTTGTWTGTAPITYAYQWKRNGSNIGGATNSTYVTVVADSTANITCVVTATNTAGSGTATSNTLTMANYTPVNSVAPAVTGTAVVGQTLTTTNGTWTNSPSTYTYQWYRGASSIGGATSSTYVLVSADAGQNIKCTVTASNGLSASADSNTIAIYASLLDLVPNAQVAYDFRLLRGAHYNNAMIRLRRSSDSAEVDVFIDSSYIISLNSNITSRTSGTTLATWVGSNNAFLVTHYDQSGNSYNYTQTDPTKQAQFISSGTIITGPTTGKPSLLFDGTNDSYDINSTYAINTSTAFANAILARPTSGGPQYQCVFSQKSNSQTFVNFFSNQATYNDFEIGSQSAFAISRYSGAPFDAIRLINVNYNGSGATTATNYAVAINNVTATRSSGGAIGASNNTSKIGSDNNTSYFKGYFSLVVSWNVDQSANQSIINGNINAYYGVY